jgi:hypothetical protein
MSEPIRNKKADFPVAPYVAPSCFTREERAFPNIFAVLISDLPVTGHRKTRQLTMHPSLRMLSSQESPASKKVT